MAIHAACDPCQLFVMEMVITRQRGSVSTVHRKKNTQKLNRLTACVRSSILTVYSQLNQLSEGVIKVHISTRPVMVVICNYLLEIRSSIV
jgi:hypothetical protein